MLPPSTIVLQKDSHLDFEFLFSNRLTDGMGPPIHYTSHSETVTPIFPATTHFNVATTKDFEEPRSEETRVGSARSAARQDFVHCNKSKSLPGAEPRQNLSNFHDPRQIVNAGSNREKKAKQQGHATGTSPRLHPRSNISDHIELAATSGARPQCFLPSSLHVFGPESSTVPADALCH